jgi:glycine cleavage system transcriptional repressor
MQLTISALGNKSSHFIGEILTSISSCKCDVLEIRTSNLAQTSASYLLVEGNWNQIAKLESSLDTLKKNLEIKVFTLRTETPTKDIEGIPYSLETVSLDHTSVLENITSFLLDRKIYIEDINASSYRSHYVQTPIFSTKFILLIPPKVQLLNLREELLEFCDKLNVDTIIEPIKN